MLNGCAATSAFDIERSVLKIEILCPCSAPSNQQTKSIEHKAVITRQAHSIAQKILIE